MIIEPDGDVEVNHFSLLVSEPNDFDARMINVGIEQGLMEFADGDDVAERAHPCLDAILLAEGG